MQNVICNFPILLVPSKFSNLSHSCGTRGGAVFSPTPVRDIFQHDRCVISAFPVLFQSTSCFPVQRDCITGVCQAIRLQLSDCRSQCLEVVLWYLRIYTFSFARYFFFFFCILIIFIDYQFYIQFTTLTYYLLHSLTHTYIQAHTHPNDKSTKILKL